jgi:DNA-directed RNA polymerase III subunit RPC7
MASRGRGRGGRGRGGGFGAYDHPAKHAEHKDFPVSLSSSSLRSALTRALHTADRSSWSGNGCASKVVSPSSSVGLIDSGCSVVQHVDLPGMTCNKASDEEKVLLQGTLKFEEFWKTSCYHLDQDAPKKSTVTEINYCNFFCFADPLRRWSFHPMSCYSRFNLLPIVRFIYLLGSK